MFFINKQAQLVTTPSEIAVSALESGLAGEGFFLGYAPQEAYGLTLEVCLQERHPNLYHFKYGGIESLCAGLQLQMKSGKTLCTKTAPRSATGPDLKKWVIGSRGIFGKITEATLKIFALPEREHSGALVFAHGRDASHFVQQLVGWRIFPLLIRQIAPGYAGIVQEHLGLCGQGTWVLLTLAGTSGMVNGEEAALEDIARPLGGQVHWAVTGVAERAYKKFLLASDPQIRTEVVVSPALGLNLPRRPVLAAWEKKMRALGS